MSRRKRTHSYRLNVARSDIELIAASVLAADNDLARALGNMVLAPSSALYGNRNGTMTARLVWRLGNITAAITARNLRVPQ